MDDSNSSKPEIYTTTKVDFFQKRFPELKDIRWDHRVELVELLSKIYLDGGGTMIKIGARHKEAS